MEPWKHRGERGRLVVAEHGSGAGGNVVTLRLRPGIIWSGSVIIWVPGENRGERGHHGKRDGEAIALGHGKTDDGTRPRPGL